MNLNLLVDLQSEMSSLKCPCVRNVWMVKINSGNEGDQREKHLLQVKIEPQTGLDDPR